MGMGKRFPFDIPTGWFQVAYGHELAPGQVLPLRYFGKDLVLFRTEDGAPHLLNAFCPHLGAHLGHGGKVRGDRLVCPFHAWEFEGSGRCALVPYTERQPPRAEVRAWHLVERNGLLMAWHDRAGRAPLWEIPEIPEYGDPGWSDYRTGDWRIRTAAQELAENQVDAAHFFYVHSSPRVHTTLAERHGPMLHTLSTIAVTTPIGVVQSRVELHSFGFGLTKIRVRGLFETLLIGCPTPIDDAHVHLRLSFIVRDLGEALTSEIGDAVMRDIERQVQEDIPIWENKAYVERPMLVEGDGPIGVFRSWVRQFYPELADETASDTPVKPSEPVAPVTPAAGSRP
jgi:3-ketosteroid 9alpha-monooxygenase subunit A